MRSPTGLTATQKYTPIGACVFILLVLMGAALSKCVKDFKRSTQASDPPTSGRLRSRRAPSRPTGVSHRSLKKSGRQVNHIFQTFGSNSKTLSSNSSKSADPIKHPNPTPSVHGQPDQNIQTGASTQPKRASSPDSPVQPGSHHVQAGSSRTHNQRSQPCQVSPGGSDDGDDPLLTQAKDKSKKQGGGIVHI